MTDPTSAFVGADIFDGNDLITDHALLVHADEVRGIVPWRDLAEGATLVDLDGGILAPGYVDLQVNGGGGVMFNDSQTPEILETISRAHATLGATSIFPTLITDTPDRTRAAIAATEAAIAQGVPGIAGLHLEGPHLSIARKGAHDPSLIRPMQEDDLDILIAAATRLPALMVTIAPENVTNSQITALREAGVIVSLGHTDSDYATCTAAAGAGATCATHLFNAMSQLGNREPGLVGTALSDGRLWAGLIADTIHGHPTSIAVALAAKTGPGKIFLVSDAMAAAGSDIDHFILNERRIERRDGRLTLSDGTLAGADLDLSTAIRNLVLKVGVPVPRALQMATSYPAKLAGLESRVGHLAPGLKADFLHLDSELYLTGIWQGGTKLDV